MSTIGFVDNGNAHLYVESHHHPNGELGHLLLLHGNGEHLGRHDWFAQAMVAQGYAVTRFDLRGCGRSSGLRGHVDRFADYLSDIDAVLSATGYEHSFIFGHSLGGLLAVLYALAHPAAVQGLILSSPCLGLQMQPPTWKVHVANALALFWPKLRLDSGLPLEGLSHDPEIPRAYMADPLCYRKVSTRWYVELERAMTQAQNSAGDLNCPTLILAGGADPVVSTAVTRNFFANMKPNIKQMVEYPDAYHELFHENCRDRALEEVLRWLSRHSG